MSVDERPAFFLSSQDTDVAETCLLTLACHAQDKDAEDVILKDEKAVEIMEALQPELETAQSGLLRQIAAGKIDERLVVFVNLRAKRFDQYALDFMAQYPQGTIVNLGCGMDTRFLRVDNGQVRFIDIDLPDVIALKRKFFAENERYILLGTSVLDFEWMEQAAQISQGGPILFLAEGLLMYLDPEHVKDLVLTLQARFPGCELVCEVYNKTWLENPLMRKIASKKMQNRFQMGKGAEFKFGLAHSREMEEWAPGIRFLDDWSLFDSDHPRMGYLRWFGKSRFMRYGQWVVHYRLGQRT